MCRFVFEFEMNWRMEDYESAGFSFEKACIDIVIFTLESWEKMIW